MIADIISTVKRLFSFTGNLLLATVLFFVIQPAVPADAFDILLGTGKTGTFSHFAGKAVCRALNRHTADINCVPVPTPDAVHNLTNLQGGSLDISLVDSRMLHDAVNKTGNFEYLDILYDNLRSLTPLYDIPLTLVVRQDAGIAALADIEGKRINTGAPLTPQRLAMETILQAKAWSRKDFSLMDELPESQSQDSMAFCHGTIQAMVHQGVHPDPALKQLFELCKAALVGMDDPDIQKLLDSHPEFIKTSISAGTYPSRPDAVFTFGTRMILTASRDLDEETVYSIMEALYRSQKQLGHAHPALSGLRKSEEKGIDLGLERHPGAERYFSEN